jgi:hypothetical protein
LQAGKSSTEAQRLREQQKSANDAVEKEKTLLLDLDVEVTALTTKRVRCDALCGMLRPLKLTILVCIKSLTMQEEQTRNAERRTAMVKTMVCSVLQYP